VAGPLGKVKINQFTKRQRVTFFPASCRRIPASGDLRKQPPRLETRRLRSPRGTVFADRKAPFRRAAARASAIVDRIGLCPTRRDHQHESLKLAIAEEIRRRMEFGRVDAGHGGKFVGF
jgi:hypothetical protein